MSSSNLIFKNQIMKIGKQSLSYISMGQGDPIIFLHGFPDYSYSWHHQLNEFSKTHHVIALDLLGYNFSAKPMELDCYVLKSLAELIFQFIKKLAFENKKLTIIGHDWGGMIAWTLASYYPDFFEKIIIINAPHPVSFQELLEVSDKQQKASEYIKLLLSSESYKILEENNYEWLKDVFITRGLRKNFISQHDVMNYTRAWSEAFSINCMINYYKASFFINTEQRISFNHGLNDIQPINIPLLVIWGEWDNALSIENLDAMNRWAKKIEIIRVPEKTHWIIHEAPQMINKLIANFLLNQTEC
jgi:pimeloyl-ACP methyl ester carboxylesterase